jgi:type III secretory pathway component EscV
MTGPTVAIVAAIVGLLLGSALVPGAPIFALPIVVVLIGVLAVLELRRRSGEARSMQGLRDEAKADAIEFTARDKQTTVESADRPA